MVCFSMSNVDWQGIVLFIVSESYTFADSSIFLLWMAIKQTHIKQTIFSTN